MGKSRKRKRRDKKHREWLAFQSEQGLSDEVLALARAPGYPLKLLVQKLAAPELAEFEIEDAIKKTHEDWRSRLNQRRPESELNPKPKKKHKPKAAPHDPNWAKAKKLCQLNAEDVRKAKQLGFKPKSLMKNIPSPKQSWKQPVKYWIRDLYQDRFG